HAAAISYYMVFSLPSMLLIVLWTGAQFYKDVLIQDTILQKITVLVGEQAARLILSTIEKLSVQEPTVLATLIGIGLLLFFATTVFDAMRTALNKIDKVKASNSVKVNIWMMFRGRMIALSLLVSISFLLLVSLVLDVMLTAVSHYLAQLIGEYAKYFLIFNMFILDFIATTVIFTLDFRYLPDTRLKWSDALIGALFTASLFALGKGIMGMFISSNQVVDLYDAAGSLLALMLWVYYAAIIFLFGATFTFNRVKKQ
ncbi:MAG TPA: YihY/virulence factor BrkB family protein, partial [Sulfurovum sp.]|nr:YihY/virulence factor BrkB family protein [Sulfurovum sp.]